MHNLDEKDKIIIEALTKNARITTKELAKLTKLKQPSIIYRISQLEENGYISKYDALINHNKVPFYKYNYFIKIPIDKKKEFEKLFTENKCSTTIYKLLNSYNYYIFTYFKTKKQIVNFENDLKKLNATFKKYEIKKVDITSFSLFDVNVKVPQLFKRNKNFYEKTKLDKADVKLVKELSNGGARDSILELSKKTGLKYDFLLYRFKKLLKENYFFLFIAQPGIKFSNIQADIILFKINNLSFEESLKRIEKTPRLFYIMEHSDGTYLTQILSRDFEDYKKNLLEFQEIFEDCLEWFEVYNTSQWIFLNRFPFEWLVEK